MMNARTAKEIRKVLKVNREKKKSMNNGVDDGDESM